MNQQNKREHWANILEQQQQSAEVSPHNLPKAQPCLNGF